MPQGTYGMRYMEVGCAGDRSKGPLEVPAMEEVIQTGASGRMVLSKEGMAAGCPKVRSSMNMRRGGQAYPCEFVPVACKVHEP